LKLCWKHVDSFVESDPDIAGMVSLYALGNDTLSKVTITDDKGLEGIVSEFDFIWETTCEKLLRSHQKTTMVVNKLHNCHILESKSNLAFLQLLIKEENLKIPNSALHIDLLGTFIALSSKEVLQWFTALWVLCIQSLLVHS